MARLPCGAHLVFCKENDDPYTSDQLNWRCSKVTRRASIGHWHVIGPAIRGGATVIDNIFDDNDAGQTA